MSTEHAPLVSCFAVLIKVLYVILVLSFVALAWAGLAMYLRVRRHMKKSRDTEHETVPKQP